VVRGATTLATREAPKATETKSVAAGPAQTEAEDPQKAERLAAAKLKQAKLFLNDGQVQDALEVLADVIERWPNTKAAAEAKNLQREWKKKPN
jgi:TolA-binding protein